MLNFKLFKNQNYIYILLKIMISNNFKIKIMQKIIRYSQVFRLFLFQCFKFLTLKIKYFKFFYFLWFYYRHNNNNFFEKLITLKNFEIIFEPLINFKNFNFYFGFK